MRRGIAVALVLLACPLLGQNVVQQAADDALVAGRVAEVSKRDLPRDLLKRMIESDIELLRGKRADGSYQYATFEKMEAGRSSISESVQSRKNEQDLQVIETRGSFVYRVIVESPSRRLLVTKNRRVWLERAEIQYIPQNSAATKVENVTIEKWLDPGNAKSVDIPEVARQATIRLLVRADKDAGYGNIIVTLIRARVIDNADSPYADAVASAKAIVRGIDNNDIPSIRAMASRMRESLAPMTDATALAPVPAGRTVDVVAPAAPENVTPVAPDIQNELQAIEDLLTGTDLERRQGVDRLHQLIRRLRTR